MRLKKVLVTGATGLIGKGLLSELHSHPFEVTAIVRSASDQNRLKKINTIFADITDQKSLMKIRSHFDIIFHLAANKRMFEKNNELKAVNIGGLDNVLNTFCTFAKRTHFVFASSIDAVIRDSDYAKTKLVGEDLVRRFAASHPFLKFTNVRIGNVYHRSTGTFDQDIRQIQSQAGWRFRLLYHELGERYLYPVELSSLSQKLSKLIQSQTRCSNKTVAAYDRQIKVKQILKHGPVPERLPFGHQLLSIWHLLGKTLRRGDLLIYLKSQK